MGFLIDTSILIEAERGRLDLALETSRRPSQPVYISVVTASELLFGAHRATEETVRTRRSSFVESILRVFPALDIDFSIAEIHARIRAELAGRGELIGPHDLWLAATCRAHDLTMVTSNSGEFVRVPGLAVEAWGQE